MDCAARTQDVDITLLIELDQIEKIGKVLIKNFTSAQKDPVDFFQKHFVLPTKHKATGIPTDSTIKKYRMSLCKFRIYLVDFILKLKPLRGLKGGYSRDLGHRVSTNKKVEYP